MYWNAKAVLLHTTLMSEKKWKQMVSMEYNMAIIFELGNWEMTQHIFFSSCKDNTDDPVG